MSMEEINVQLNTAKADYQLGGQLADAASEQAGEITARLSAIHTTLRTLSGHDLPRLVEELTATAAAAREATGEGYAIVQETTRDSPNPHAVLARQKGGEVHRLLGGEQTDTNVPVSLGEIAVEVASIVTRLAALNEDVGSTRLGFSAMRIQLGSAGLGATKTAEHITDYQASTGTQ